jgi:DNA-binding SARP family transcriptional activator
MSSSSRHFRRSRSLIAQAALKRAKCGLMTANRPHAEATRSAHSAALAPDHSAWRSHSWEQLDAALRAYVGGDGDSTMDDVSALLAIADSARDRRLPTKNIEASDVEACALALAIERQHDARETFVGLAGLNARLIELFDANKAWPAEAAGRTGTALTHEWQLVFVNGLALAALYTPGELASREAICDDLHRRVVFGPQSKTSTLGAGALERLRLRAATTLLAYADLRDSSNVLAELEGVASEAAARLPAGALEHTRWLAERLVIVMFRIFREPDGATEALRLSDELTGWLEQFPDAVASFKLGRARADISRAQGNFSALQDDLQQCERAQRTLGPRKRTTLVTLQRLRGSTAMTKGMPLEAERHYKAALELAKIIDAPVMHVSNLLMHLVGALAEQRRYAEAASTLKEVENSTAPQHSDLVRPRRQIYEFLARWANDRPGALTALRGAMTTCRETQVYQFLGHASELAASVCATALEHDIEPAFIVAAIQRRSLVPPSRVCIKWPWAVRLHLFGGFEMLGETVSARRGKAQQKPVAVLQALALLGPRGGDRRALARRVYGSGDLDAPATLDMAIARSRKLLGDDSLIVFQDGRIRLDDERVFVDLWAFDALDANLAQQANADAPNLHELKSISHALTTLYTGSLLLDDASDVASANLVQQYRERFIGNAIKLSHLLAKANEAGAASELLQLAITREADSELLYRTLIEVLIDAGENGEAMRWYRRCEESVAKGFGVALSEKTTRLLERLQTVAAKPASKQLF